MSVKEVGNLTTYRLVYPVRFWGGVFCLIVALVCGLILLGQIIGVVPEIKEFLIEDSSFTTVYELSWQVHDLKRDAARTELVSHFKGRAFEVPGIVVMMGTLKSGEIYAAVEGKAWETDTERFECHFPPEMEPMIKEAYESAADERFTGTVLGYTKGWVIAGSCSLTP